MDSTHCRAHGCQRDTRGTNWCDDHYFGGVVDDITRVECATCGWYNESRDEKWTKHAGWVHVTMLKPGHVLGGAR